MVEVNLPGTENLSSYRSFTHNQEGEFVRQCADERKSPDIQPFLQLTGVGVTTLMCVYSSGRR